MSIDITGNPVRERGVGRNHWVQLLGRLISLPHLLWWAAAGTAEQRGFQVINCRDRSQVACCR